MHARLFSKKFSYTPKFEEVLLFAPFKYAFVFLGRNPSILSPYNERVILLISKFIGNNKCSDSVQPVRLLLLHSTTVRTQIQQANQRYEQLSEVYEDAVHQPKRM